MVRTLKFLQNYKTIGRFAQPRELPTLSIINTTSSSSSIGEGGGVIDVITAGGVDDVEYEGVENVSSCILSISALIVLINCSA